MNAAGTMVRAADITDGLSNTAAFSERLVWPTYAPEPVDLTGMPEEWPRVVLQVSGGSATSHEFVDACQLTGAPFVPQLWTPGSEFSTLIPPNGNSCLGRGYHAITANSLHSHGVHVLLVDGAVRFVSSNVEQTAWEALGSRSGNDGVAFTPF